MDGANYTNELSRALGAIWCDDLVEGEVAHSCAHGPGPHVRQRRVLDAAFIQDRAGEGAAPT